MDEYRCRRENRGGARYPVVTLCRPKQVHHARFQFLYLKGFGEIRVTPGFKTLDAVFRKRVGRDGDYRDS